VSRTLRAHNAPISRCHHLYHCVLTFCPQMNPAEARKPALVRYIVELTRRVGKLRNWLILLALGSNHEATRRHLAKG